MAMTHRPVTFAQALAIAKQKDVTIYAGGTDLMVKKKTVSGVLPAFEKDVLFLSDLEELKHISIHSNETLIGACCTLHSLSQSSNIQECIRTACLEMASPAIRNLATVGGNICNASPAGDILPALYALHATVILEDQEGKRELPLEDFIVGPGRTLLRKGELLKYIKIPKTSFDKYYYKKVGTRKANALSKLSIVVLSKTNAEQIQDIRIALGAVAPTVVKIQSNEEKIIGLSKSELLKTLEELVKNYEPHIQPIDDQRSTAIYRKTVTLNLLRHALSSL